VIDGTASETWAVVVAALGASLLTTVGLLFVEFQRGRRSSRESRDRDRFEAYAELLRRSSTIDLVAQSLALTMESRSGLAEQVGLITGQRRLVEPTQIELHLRRDLEPFALAAAQVLLVGSPEAMVASQELADAVGDLVEAVIARGEAGGVLARKVRGEIRSEDQNRVADECRAALGRARMRFADVARKDLGSGPLGLSTEMRGG
jgi:hypothetical protein